MCEYLAVASSHRLFLKMFSLLQHHSKIITHFRSKRTSGNVSLLSFSNDGLVQNQNVILEFIAIYFGLVTLLIYLKLKNFFLSSAHAF